MFSSTLYLFYVSRLDAFYIEVSTSAVEHLIRFFFKAVYLYWESIAGGLIKPGISFV